MELLRTFEVLKFIKALRAVTVPMEVVSLEMYHLKVRGTSERCKLIGQ